jgi:hypothetical protein
MAERGYTTPDQIADELGQDLTLAQIQQCHALIEQAEDWIDWYKGQTYSTSTAITDERHRIEGPTLYLRNTPLASVQRIRQTYGAVGETPVTLTADTDYEVISLTTGELRVALYRYGEVLVDYTPAITVPARINRATTLLVAHWMGDSTSGVPSGVQEYAVGGELRVKYAEGSVGQVPSEVLSLLGGRRIVFA